MLGVSQTILTKYQSITVLTVYSISVIVLSKTHCQYTESVLYLAT